MEWKTRITDLFGCKYPILEGAFGRTGTWQLAVACSETGALGMITAGASRTPERLRKDINQYRDACDKPFAVNLTFGPCPHIKEMFEVCLEEKIEIIETAAYKPDIFAPRIKEAGMKWIHKSARVKDALYAENLGADACIVVGLEGAGFKSPEQLPTLITTVWAKRVLKVPFISAGGIGDARGFLGAMGMGADGIMMATAFMATEEYPVSDRAKQGLVQARADDPQQRYRVLTSADPEKYAAVMKLRGTMPEMEWLWTLEGVKPKPYPEAGTRKGGRAVPNLGSSLAVNVIDRVRPVKGLIDDIVREAEELLDKQEFLKTR